MRVALFIDESTFTAPGRVHFISIPKTTHLSQGKTPGRRGGSRFDDGCTIS